MSKASGGSRYGNILQKAYIKVEIPIDILGKMVYFISTYKQFNKRNLYMLIIG